MAKATKAVNGETPPIPPIPNPAAPGETPPPDLGASEKEGGPTPDPVPSGETPPIPPTPEPPTPLVEQTMAKQANPMLQPSTSVFHHARAGRIALHSGIGYPGEVDARFIGGVYRPANMAEQLALCEVMKTDRDLEEIKE